MKARNLLALGLVIFAHAFSAGAQTVDSATRDLLIKKLTQVYLNLAPSDSSKTGVTLRLADLHAERARIDSMKELESGCTTCVAGKEDRVKALAYYNEVLGKVPETSVGKVLAQVGHLYELTGNEKEAIATYTKIISENKSAEAVAEAHLSLAEVYFKRRDFAGAKANYAAVIASPRAGSKGLAAYRQSWCEFNLGNLESAIQGLTQILRSSELLSRSGAAGIVQVDKEFQEEVSRDLSTFLARRPVTLADAELVYSLSPDQAKLANLIYLAGEAERVGQAAAAIELWRYSQEKQSKPQARLEGHVRLAQLEMEQKLRADAIHDFDAALALWSELGKCDGSDCAELKLRLRKFVIDWNRVEKKAPSEELLKAYRSYLKVFPGEIDMTVWAAQVAGDLKTYAGAIELYQQAARTATELLKAAGAKGDKDVSEKLEVALLGAIEAAELSKEPVLFDSAYDSYLKLSQERKKAVEVQYQKAHLIYDRGEHEGAALALREVALLKVGGNPSVKKQAADLSLDSLVLLKDDARLEAWAAEYARVFPKDAAEFSAISRKAILTQAATAGGAGTSSDAIKNVTALADAWKTLSRFEARDASDEEKAAYYKNKLILAEKLQKFAEAREVVEAMLRIQSLGPADRQYALSRKAWLSELILDFDTALAATEKIQGPESGVQPGAKWLKLAMYADLAAKDPRPYYAQFLKASNDEDKTVAIAAELVRESKEPLKELEKSKALLKKRPETLAQLYLETYAKTGSMDVVKKALASGVSSTVAGKVLGRIAILDDYAKLKSQLAPHALDGTSQKKLGMTIKARVAMLDQAEKLASRAIESGDWTAELVALDLLGHQNERFYQELLSLPLPAGLSAEDEQQYLMLLSQQAAPHQVRATDVLKKVDEFWQNEKALTLLSQALDKESGPLRAIVVGEVKALAEVSPEAKKAQFAALLERKELSRELPSLAVLEGARQAVRENPMNREKLEALLGLEKKLGRQAMVNYLEGRIQALE